MTHRPLSTTREGPRSPFVDTRVETYSRLRASNAGIKNSAKEAGIALISAQKLEKNDAVQERMVEIRENARAFTTVSMGAIMDRLWRNATEAAEGRGGDYKASNQALQMLISLTQKDGSRAAGMLMGVRSPSELRDQFRELLSSPALPVATDTTSADSEGVEEADTEGDDKPTSH
jgi:hypothetical protein